MTHVDDLDDPRLGDYVRLRDVQLRTKLESERGIYLAEGEKVVRRAVEAGHRPRSFLMAPRWLDGLADVLDRLDAPCFVLDESRIETLTGFHVHRGALAAFERPEPVPVADVLAGARRVVVVEDLVDHTNIGAVFRNVAALGFDAVLLSPRCADPFYRRSIKVAMGAVFPLPHARLDDWYAAPALLREAGFTTYAMTLARRRGAAGRTSRPTSSGWPWSSVARGTGSASTGSARPTSASPSRWPTASTRSTSPRRSRSRAGTSDRVISPRRRR